MAAYYNENDPKTAAWLRELIRQGLIADGEVDDRSIVDVQPDDLRGFVQCHFFAGIGGWSYALRLAGWPDDRAVWTGSCPCQPWSMAGSGEGADDPRHLWPAWKRLIEVARPAVLFGEQVASKDGLYWLDLVYVDLEALGYAVGAFDLCAASVGAPHIRQRLWIVANAHGGVASDGDVQRSWRYVQQPEDAVTCGVEHAAREQVGISRRARKQGNSNGDVADANARGLGSDRPAPSDDCQASVTHAHQCQSAGELGHTDTSGFEARDGVPVGDEARSTQPPHPGHWSRADWIACADGKWRPVEPGTFPLAHGIPARVGRLRGYGNAIVPQVAAEVIAAYMDVAESRLSPSVGEAG